MEPRCRHPLDNYPIATHEDVVQQLHTKIRERRIFRTNLVVVANYYSFHPLLPNRTHRMMSPRRPLIFIPLLCRTRSKSAQVQYWSRHAIPAITWWTIRRIKFFILQWKISKKLWLYCTVQTDQTHQVLYMKQKIKTGRHSIVHLPQQTSTSAPKNNHEELLIEDHWFLDFLFRFFHARTGFCCN